MGFQQGLSGLSAASKSLDTVGNNIANAGTIGFKSGSTQFADVFAASLSGAGTSPVGIGAKVAAIVQQFSQGNIAVTNNPLDTAINGGGFFQMDDGSGGTIYGRNGQFQLDKDGFIVNAQGLQLKGIAAVNGVIAAGSPPVPLRLFDPTQSLSGTPQMTGGSAAATGVQVNANLDSRLAPPVTTVFNSVDPTSYNQSTATTIYDSLGNPHTFSMYFVRTAAINTWAVYATLTNPAGAVPAFTDLSAPTAAAAAAAVTAATTETTAADASNAAATAAAALAGADAASILAAVPASPALMQSAAATAAAIGTTAETAAAAAADPGAAAAAVATVAGVPASVVTAANTAAAVGGATVLSVTAAVKVATSAYVASEVALASPQAVLASVAGAPAAVLTAATTAAGMPGATTASVLAAVNAAAAASAAPTPIGNMTFNSSGALTSPAFAMALTDAQMGYTGAVTSPQTFPVDFRGSTQYGAQFAVNAMIQDGYSSGTLAGFNIGKDGVVLGRYTNGQTKPVGQVILASFRNPQGLQPLGDNRWGQSPTSGDPIVGAPGSSGQYGVLQSAGVEESNVDLTAELVNMITQQRFYQANAQTVKTQDSILQTLVNLR